MTRAVIRIVFCGALFGLTAAAALAQSQTTTTAETKKFHVIEVAGNSLVVKLPEGTKELTVPDDFKFNVDGKMLSVHELKPGMSGTATITTTTTVTPVTVTEVKDGTVMKNLGTSILVRTADGIKMFSQADVDKRGIKIWRHGEPAEITEFRENDKLSATIVTTMPPEVVTRKQVNAILARNAAGTPAAAGMPTSSMAANSPAAAKHLPKTASSLPLLALTGFASLLAALTLTVRRRGATS